MYIYSLSLLFSVLLARLNAVFGWIAPPAARQPWRFSNFTITIITDQSRGFRGTFWLAASTFEINCIKFSKQNGMLVYWSSDSLRLKDPPPATLYWIRTGVLVLVQAVSNLGLIYFFCPRIIWILLTFQLEFFYLVSLPNKGSINWFAVPHGICGWKMYKRPFSRNSSCSFFWVFSVFSIFHILPLALPPRLVELENGYFGIIRLWETLIL